MTDAKVQDEQAARLRLAFFMFQAVGHKTHYLNWRRGVEALGGPIDATWFPIENSIDEPLIEKLPLLSTYRKRELSGWLKIRRGLRKGPFDAVLMNTAQMAVKHLRPLSKQRLFLFIDSTRRQIEEFAPWFPAGETEQGFLGKIRKQRQRNMVKAATGLLSSSSWTARSLVEDYGADPARVHVLPFGIDPTLWSPGPEAKPRDGKTRLLFIGGNFERKGGDLLLRWARSTSRTNWELNIVTAGAREAIDNVIYHQASNNSDALISLARRCDLFVLPTRADCSPFVVLEAMSTGMPVLSTRVGGIPEMIIEGKTGGLIAPDNYDALHQRLDAMLEKPELFPAMGEAARARVLAEFDSRQIVRRGLAIVAAACGKRRE